ncbi:unnamed protein product [Paramecium octaurelia]|uniref:Ethanolaminephosphotransferase n=1 Tax=Paramecium octaurelia TaxID=43137 RepID=A0A8S1XWP9_PAROT|nr:unnamed protein product [Paramecium octaurelia]
MAFISNTGLENLKKYKYVSGGYSYLDNKINPFWIFVSELYPTWLAPNLITFIGFITMILACIFQVFADMTLTQEIPTWTFYFMAFAIFAYQTLDATDGKQARRTQSSSPLGQLFDHGCDSFIMQFFIIGAAQATLMDRDTLFYFQFFCQIGLWAINQKEYYTGVLHTHLANFGVTELELVAISVQLFSAIFGQSAWHNKIFGFNLYKIVTTTILGAAIISDIFLFFSNIFKSQKPLRVFSEWIPLFLFWTLQFVWFSSPIYSQLAGPLLINFGIILSSIVCKTIVCSTTKDQTPLFHLEMLPFIIISLLTFFIPFSLEHLKILFWIQFISTIVLTLLFIKNVINQITTYLNISCFTIKKKEN